MNPNKGKVKWIVVIGQPNLEHEAWMNTKPNMVLVGRPLNGQKFDTKKEATDHAKRHEGGNHPWHFNAEKFRPHRPNED